MRIGEEVMWCPTFHLEISFALVIVLAIGKLEGDSQMREGKERKERARGVQDRNINTYFLVSICFV